jgi:hypothetical protein
MRFIKLAARFKIFQIRVVAATKSIISPKINDIEHSKEGIKNPKDIVLI